MKRLILLLNVLGITAGLAGPGSPAWAGALEETFAHSPREATPWVYWMWLRTPTSHEAMTRDLEEMKAKGITGLILYDNGAGGMEYPSRKMVPGDKAFVSVPTDDFRGAYATPLPVLATWSPEWRNEIRYAASESTRLGLDFCLACGLAGCSAPGLDPQYSEQQLVWSSQDATGPSTVDAALPMPGPGGPSHLPYRDVAVVAMPVKDHVAPADVLDITGNMDASGHLQWEVPAGTWRILRFGQEPIGLKNPWGLFCDHLSTEGFDQCWALTMAPLLKEMTPAERAGFKYVEDDSWEAGNPTWTKAFPEEFRKRRGYSITPYLPILAGQTLVDGTTSQQFKRDYAVTISDLEVDHYYSHMRDVCHATGLTLYSEANGPNYRGIDVTQSGLHVDRNMGEFWMPSAHRPTPDRRFLTRDAVTSNHLRGEPVTMCEAFTSVAPAWSESPLSIKACADQAFCDGVNRVCIHNYSHSPLLDAKPGDVYFAGTHINRNITWWDEAPALFDYLSRCCGLLQQGHFVADALFYIGDGVNEAAPMKQVYPTLGPGYDYDRTDAAALINLASVKDGRIVLSTGMTYRVLILPDNAPMSVEGLQKIASLVEAGATVTGPRPARLPGLPVKPGEAAAFNTLVAHLWGAAPAGPGVRTVGLGHVYESTPAHEVLQGSGAPPDFEYAGLSAHGEMDWIHRATATADIYYVASRWFSTEKVTCKFRVTGRQPELWDPVTGVMRDAPAFRQEEGRTILPLEFDPCGSVFVVFSKQIAPAAAGTAESNYPALRAVGTVPGPWRVAFDPKWGGPAQPVTFDTLTDWTQNPEQGIKYYSGAAIYDGKFDMPAAPAAGERYVLDLGNVREVAAVKLNGRDLGVVWAKPARVDITPALRKSGNQLEITVVNLWPNRLIGDSFLPPDQQVTKTNMHYYTHASPLLPSGLLGPVQIFAAAK